MSELQEENVDFSKQIAEIKALQLKSIQNRKELSSNTKTFKKLTSDELKLKEFKSLLKQYQMEIDSLTKRCASSEEFIIKANEINETNKQEELSKEDEAIKEKEKDDLLSNELELKEERITQLVLRNEELMDELRKAKVQKSKIDSEEDNLIKLNQLEFENIQLINKLDNLETENKSSKNQIVNLNKSIESLNKENSNLSSNLNKLKDYDDIKNELNTLRVISFGGDVNEKNSFDDSDSEDDDEEEEDQLDEILISRNKKLNDDLIKYRSNQSEFENKIKALEDKLNDSLITIEKLNKANETLENELNHFDKSINNNNFDTMSISSTFTKKTGRRLSPASSIAGGIIEEEENHSLSVLPIITSQRDRFRSKNIELESQLKKQTILINELRLEISKLKKSNTELFERTRYLSSFQKGTVNRFNSKDHENQIENNYEESLHPLAKFRQIEQERIASKLSPLERIFLSFAKAILANKTSRMLFLIYCFGLHCLIMLMSIYVMSLHGTLTPEVGKLDKTVTTIN